MRLDGLEIKANIARDGVPDAMEALQLDDRSSWRIWFYEDTSPGLSLPLLEAGLAIRVRAKGDDDGDCTVKLRPCRRSQVTPTWLATTETDDLELTVEEDWAGDRRVLAVSGKGELGPAALAAVLASPHPPDDLLGADQARFLADCASLRVNVAELTRLGPIEATRWKDVAAEGLADLGARAERWQVAGLDFLEVSIKVEVDADQAREEFLDALAALGVLLDASQETKTRRVLTALAG
jgi:hypothetical protein